MKYLTSLACIAITLTGCASIVTGTQQRVAVTTSPTSKATCKLYNSKGEWEVPTTPDSVTIHRAYGDLSVECKNKNSSGLTKAVSSTKAMMFGNILFGGPIGALIDAGTGAGYDYPDSILVPLKENGSY